MNAHVLKGSKTAIAESITRINGEIHEAIVFIEDQVNPVPAQTEEDMFVEMEQFTVRAVGVDYSRDSLYTQMEGE